MKKINYDFDCCAGYSYLKNGSLVRIILKTNIKSNNIEKFIY